VYKYLGVQVSFDLSWEAAIDARCEATRKAIFACAKVLRNRDLSHFIRLRYFEATIMPVALYGSELWANELTVCRRVETVIATGLRLIVFAPRNTSREAIAWELGYAPFHLRVAARRMRLAQKMGRLNTSTSTSAVWAKRIFDSRNAVKGKSWSWFRRSEHMAKKWLLTGVDKITLAMDPKQLQGSASMGYYRLWSKQGGAVYRRLIGDLHKDDTELSLVPYLREKGSDAHVLLRLRCGALWFNDRVGKFCKERPTHCLSCATDTTRRKETLGHFLMECPRYNYERECWASAWHTTRELLFPSHEPIHLSAALGESVQFFGGDDTTGFQKCRMLTIRSMWNKRCAILASSLQSQLRVLPPGVNAD
jgi:hypothetical protein